jgi:Flp pilus assembly protein TadG
MKIKFGLFSLLSRLCKDGHGSSSRLLVRLLRDEAGSYLIYMAMTTPLLLGICGLGTEGGLWLYKHQTLQAAADAAAVSAAIAYADAEAYGTQANAIAATYGFVNGDGVTTIPAPIVTVNPDVTNPYTTIQVTIEQKQTLFFAGLPLGNWQPVTLSANATAITTSIQGGSCMLALGTSGTDFNFSGGAKVLASGCGIYSNSNSTGSINVAGNSTSVSATGIGNILVACKAGVCGTLTTSGNPTVTPSQPALGPQDPSPFLKLDPYADNPPITCTASTCSCTGTCTSHNNDCGNTNCTLPVGVYTNGITVNNGKTTTLAAGIYYVNGGLNIMGTLNAPNGTTIVLNGSTGVSEGGSAGNINITAPTSGKTMGFAFYAPFVTTSDLSSGGSQIINGLIYMPKATLTYKGSSSNSPACTEITASAYKITGGTLYLTSTSCPPSSYNGRTTVVQLVN